MFFVAPETFFVAPDALLAAPEAFLVAPEKFLVAPPFFTKNIKKTKNTHTHVFSTQPNMFSGVLCCCKILTCAFIGFLSEST